MSNKDLNMVIEAAKCCISMSKICDERCPLFTVEKKSCQDYFSEAILTMHEKLQRISVVADYEYTDEIEVSINE